MRVLVLEDEPILQMDLAMMLEGRGYRVSTSETAEGAESDDAEGGKRRRRAGR